jgi:hypothetical protein
MESSSSISRLRELHGSGYEIVDGQPDIIGWTIKDENNYRIGVVDDLLFDPEEQKVRYIIAHLKDNELDLEKRKVIIPIGIAQLHETNDDVILPSISRWQLRALPSYGQRMTTEDEKDIYTIFSTESGTTLAQQDKTGQPQQFYNTPAYDHDNLFRKRKQTGQQDKPVARTLRMRPGATPGVQDDYRERETSTRSTSERSVYEPEHTLAASDMGRNTDSANMRQNLGSPATETESVLNRIKRMHQELNEIERDLRNSREGRTS